MSVRPASAPAARGAATKAFGNPRRRLLAGAGRILPRPGRRLHPLSRRSSRVRFFDVSMPVAPVTAPWPGDAPFECGWTMRREAGDSVDVGWIRTSVHNGTHVDAPLHVLEGAAAVDTLP